MQSNADSFFSRYCKLMNPETVSKHSTYPFKDHPQFAVITDILARKHTHHAALHADFFNQYALAFLSALAVHFQQESLPFNLRGAQILWLDIENITLTKADQTTIEADFNLLFEKLNETDKYVIFVLPAIAWLAKNKGENGFLQTYFKKLIDHPQCRILALTNPTDFRQHQLQESGLPLINIHPLTATDIIHLLQQQRAELEEFHHVLIPDETLADAYSLAKRYLGSPNALSKAILLIDSAAARIQTTEHLDDTSHLKPVLTTQGLLAVLSAYTRIPVSHLNAKTRSQEFLQGLQQTLYGQDAAISLIHAGCQQSQITLQEHNGPLASFLFAGPAHTGKMTAAIALTTQYFQQQQMLYFVQPMTSAHQSLADASLQPYARHHFLSLREVIQETPYAVIVFENIDQASTIVMEGLQDIFRTGFLHDVGGQYHDFRSSLLIFTTTAASQRLLEITKVLSAEDNAHHADLMQLIMNERRHDELTIKPHYSPHELALEIAPALSAHLPAFFLQQVSIIPFLPLNKMAVEKILRMKLTKLGKQLQALHGVDLGYAPEVMRYLVKEAVLQQETHQQVVDIDHMLKPLYLLIEQTLSHSSKQHSAQVFLTLNETGQILQCEWMSSIPIRQHTQ